MEVIAHYYPFSGTHSQEAHPELDSNFNTKLRGHYMAQLLPYTLVAPRHSTR